MDINKNANLSMLCDFYELTMGNGYFVQGMQDRITYFDIFFRSVPDNGGYAIAAGLAGTGHRIYPAAALRRGRYRLSAQPEHV